MEVTTKFQLDSVTIAMEGKDENYNFVKKKKKIIMFKNDITRKSMTQHSIAFAILEQRKKRGRVKQPEPVNFI